MHLPTSPLVSELLEGVNSSFQKFHEDQAQGAFLSNPGVRSWKFYKTSEAQFQVPYSVPPGVAPLVNSTAAEVRKRHTTMSPSLTSTMEALLASVCETASWMDQVIPAVGEFASQVHADNRSSFERMLLSLGRSVEFLAGQATAALGNLVLARRDTLLSQPQSTVPPEALSRLRHAPLPSSAAIMPTALLESALTLSRASASDQLVRKTLHPPRIPKKPSGQGQSRARASPDRGGTSPVVPRSQSGQGQRSSSSGHQKKKTKRGGQGKGKRSGNKGSNRKGGGKQHS